MINLDTIKALPIRSFLEKQGITPVIDKGYYGLYRSPYRVDTVPSFKVDYCRNLWCDYGTGEGGSIIDLVMRLEKCSVGDAIRILEDTPDQIRIPTYLPPEDHPPALIITEIKPLAHPALVRYLKSRRIDENIAKVHCHEIIYKVGEKAYFAVGFQNDSGGWELRNKAFKGSSTPKGITTLRSGKSRLLVFEGFIDYLSYLMLKRSDPPSSSDILVLNSVSNTKRAQAVLQAYKEIGTCLDNDDAGRKATEQIRQLAPDAVIRDYSPYYRESNDLNDYLVTISHERKAL